MIESSATADLLSKTDDVSCIEAPLTAMSQPPPRGWASPSAEPPGATDTDSHRAFSNTQKERPDDLSKLATKPGYSPATEPPKHTIAETTTVTATVRIDERWLSWIVSGVKTHEGRLFRGMWSKLALGQKLVAYSERYSHVDLVVQDVLRFEDFDAAFASLGKRLVP